MLARKPEAVNDKPVTAKIFLTSFLQYEIVCFCGFFLPPCNVYTITNVSKWDLWPKCRHLVERLFSQHFMKEVLLWIMNERWLQRYPPRRISLISIPSVVSQPSPSSTIPLGLTIRNSWVLPSVLYSSKDFLTRNLASAIWLCMLRSSNRLTQGRIHIQGQLFWQATKLPLYRKSSF